MRSIYRAKKFIRRDDGHVLCVLNPLPQGLNDHERQRAEELREQIKAQAKDWLLGGHVLIDVYDDGHAEPAPFLWELRSDPDNPLSGKCLDDPINAQVQEVFLELHGDEYRSARHPSETTPDEDVQAWIAWALKRNGLCGQIAHAPQVGG